MIRAIFMSLFCCLLLAAGNNAFGQATTPFYDNTHFEKRIDPTRNMPLGKMRYALIDNSPVAATGCNRSYVCTYTSDMICLGNRTILSTSPVYKNGGGLNKIHSRFNLDANKGLLFKK